MHVPLPPQAPDIPVAHDRHRHLCFPVYHACRAVPHNNTVARVDRSRRISVTNPFVLPPLPSPFQRDGVNSKTTTNSVGIFSCYYHYYYCCCCYCCDSNSTLTWSSCRRLRHHHRSLASSFSRVSTPRHSWLSHQKNGPSNKNARRSKAYWTSPTHTPTSRPKKISRAFHFFFPSSSIPARLLPTRSHFFLTTSVPLSRKNFCYYPPSETLALHRDHLFFFLIDIDAVTCVGRVTRV
jgi:hypothetical protein